MKRMIPQTLFGRLTLLLASALIISQAISIPLVFEILGPPPAFDKPPPEAVKGHWLMWIDLALRMVALGIAAWIAARWLATPMRELAQAAHAFGQQSDAPHLAESGPIECRTTARVFNQMRLQIQHQLDEKNRFVAAVSHDLRTPLTRLALRSEQVSDVALRARLQQDIAEMNTMINATLEYLRGDKSVEPAQRLNLFSLLDSIAQDFQDMGLNVTLLPAVADETTELMALTIKTEASSLRRCICNLVENAARYGGSAEISLQSSPGAVNICITDHGPGISEKELENVMLPFYRLEGSRNKNSGGVGLGLAIASDIAKQLNGKLTLCNRSTGGMLATISLPVEGC